VEWPGTRAERRATKRERKKGEEKEKDGKKTKIRSSLPEGGFKKEGGTTGLRENFAKQKYECIGEEKIIRQR